MIAHYVINNPSHYFETPEDIVADKTINTDDKIAALKSWAHDLRELSVAEEENMTGESDSSLMGRVTDCLTQLGYSNSRDAHSLNKQGD